MRKKIGQFKVQADDGQIFTLYEYQALIDIGTKADPSATLPGLKELVTSDGMRVSYELDGAYEIVSLGLRVHRIP